jgi:hypothetical protein
MNTNITEILNRSSQGITRPFLCRGDNGLLYYVKGHGAGRKALISEWIAGTLAKRLGLPIPDFTLATIPEQLISLSAIDDIADLGSGTGFGSQVIENTDELSYLFIEQLDIELRAKILLFDWWTANGDRTLTEHGGNPNILWIHRDHRPIIIDHNLAFEDATLVDFWTTHIFTEARSAWTPAFQHQMTDLMRAALADLHQDWADMPPEWTEIETGLTLDTVTKLLWRFERNHGKFWEVQ